MLIRNYGLFWHRESVFWGRQKVKGRLEGVPASSVRAKIVDFREQAGVYVLYDDNFRVIYVGQAGAGNSRLFSRLKKHTKDALADRWTRFSWFGLRWVKRNNKLSNVAAGVPVRHKDLLDHIEAILISATEPPHNKQGGKFGKKVKQYIQHRDYDEFGPSSEVMIKEIWEKIKNT